MIAPICIKKKEMNTIKKIIISKFREFTFREEGRLIVYPSRFQKMPACIWPAKLHNKEIVQVKCKLKMSQKPSRAL